MRSIKAVALALILCLGLTPDLLAQQSQTSIFRAFAQEKIVVSSTAIGFTAGTIAASGVRASKAECSLETDAIRYAVGTDPAADTGFKVLVNTNFSIYGYENISRFRAIRITNDATLNCIYSR